MQKTKTAMVPKGGRIGNAGLLAVLLLPLFLSFVGCESDSPYVPSEKNDLTSFTITQGTETYEGKPDYTKDNTFIVTLPTAIEWEDLSWDYEVSPLATLITPVKEEDSFLPFGLFSASQLFLVEAENGDRAEWTVEIKDDPTNLKLSAALLGDDLDVKFFYVTPNQQPAATLPDDILYLSYFTHDNFKDDPEDNGTTYYSTLVISTAGFSDVSWKVDGLEPINHDEQQDGRGLDNILTIHAKDYRLEQPHRVVFRGTKRDDDGNDLGTYSGTFIFKVREVTEGGN